MATIRDWKKEVSNLRKSAETFRTFDNDAALMRCRKSMEAIQYSIFEEINGELPTTYLPFEKMMGKKVLGFTYQHRFELIFKQYISGETMAVIIKLMVSQTNLKLSQRLVP